MTDPDDAPPPLLVDTAEGLARLVARLEGEPRIALDTEADSLHAFREQVCVVQISAPGLDAILDPLAIRDLSPLRALADREGGLLVLHGGDYDISMLSRDHGFRFRDVFDTMIAATLLGEPRVGLAALVESAYGVVLSKKHQTADWRRRPFTPGARPVPARGHGATCSGCTSASTPASARPTSPRRRASSSAGSRRARGRRGATIPRPGAGSRAPRSSTPSGARSSPRRSPGARAGRAPTTCPASR